jgi:hypothetical protein
MENFGDSLQLAGLLKEALHELGERIISRMAEIFKAKVVQKAKEKALRRRKVAKVAKPNKRNLRRTWMTKKHPKTKIPLGWPVNAGENYICKWSSRPKTTGGSKRHSVDSIWRMVNCQQSVFDPGGGCQYLPDW